MRTVLWFVLAVALSLAGSGCASRKGTVPVVWEDPSVLMASPPPANTTVEAPQTPTLATQTPAAAVKQAPAPATQTAPTEAQTAAPAPANQKLIVTPENSVVGKVATVNQTAGFVVLSFPVGHVPAVDQRLSLYRRGLKVGEVKITGPQIDENVVADVVAGDSDVGDEVK
ncbi:MAG: hypothetical protein QOJ40_1179 [Verrucomicrobiota bacterium]